MTKNMASGKNELGREQMGRARERNGEECLRQSVAEKGNQHGLRK
jgi:hypothetical protein